MDKDDETRRIETITVTVSGSTNTIFVERPRREEERKEMSRVDFVSGVDGGT